MKKGLLALAAVAMALVLAVPAPARAAGAEVRLAPLGRSYAPPHLGHKQGWLSISNRDWQDYTWVENKKGRATLYEGRMGYPGAVYIPSGTTITIAVEKDTWEIMGNTNDKLKVKVREGRTSTVSLEPFGYSGNNGLRGISNDGDRVRDEVLFDAYVPPVIVQQPPTVIVERPAPPPVIIERPAPPVIIERPAPPPVIVHRPPVVVHRPPPVIHRPPPPPPPRPSHRPHRDKGWGFNFGFSSR